MDANIWMPALSPELAFLSRHWSTAEEIGAQKGNGKVKQLTEAVYERACVHADMVFKALEEAVSAKAGDILRIAWVNTNRGTNWASWARLYMPRSRTRIASAGFWLGYDSMALRLIGWLWPQWGGLDGRRELVRICRSKVSATCLACEHPQKYPGLTEDDGIVWYDRKLSERLTTDDLASDLAQQARVFFKAAKPVLRELAGV